MDATDQVILVADDEANILMLLEMELQAEGFKTIGCNDGAAAGREGSNGRLDWGEGGSLPRMYNSRLTF